jgi:hypothetical protein
MPYDGTNIEIKRGFYLSAKKRGSKWTYEPCFYGYWYTNTFFLCFLGRLENPEEQAEDYT